MDYAEVILPVAIPRLFTYGIPPGWAGSVSPGCRVRVEMGRSRGRQYEGIVASVHHQAPSFRVKNILEVYDQEYSVSTRVLNFWEWMAGYYMCTRGEVLKAALPHCMAGSAAVQTETCIAWAAAPPPDLEIHALLDTLSSRAPRQCEVFRSFIELSGFSGDFERSEVPRRELLEHAQNDGVALRALMRKKILQAVERPVVVAAPVRAVSADAPTGLPLLSPPQEEALQALNASAEQHEVTLLHGVSAGGKTEIYIHLMAAALARGEQVLYLMPEIALTTQMIERLQKVFGHRVEVYHSKCSEAVRHQIWSRVNRSDSGGCIVLGARSSVFLPFRNLGLVVVDEEHEPGYKQYDPAPRYHARDASIYLASLHGAKVVLGTATPSVESYFNASRGKYGLVELTERFREGTRPLIELLDTADARKRKKMRGIFHPTLLEEIQLCLDRNQQVLLFQNRRGFAPYVQCARCGYIPRCIHCDVSLTYHKGRNHLICHYCGHNTPLTEVCPKCGSEHFTQAGFGTERIEEELHRLFPAARVARMDLDTMRTRNQYEQMLQCFARGEIDILAGTQMITKGLDFDGVSLVGVLHSDHLLNYPDFRAYERTFHMLAQVSGRAGRRALQGKVLIQCTDTAHPILYQVLHSDFAAMYSDQMAERKLFRYPPYYRLIRISLKHKNEEVVHRAAIHLAEQLRSRFGARVIGPEAPVVSRLHQYFLRDILLKVEREASFARAREILGEQIDLLMAQPECSTLMVVPDVDPM